MGYLTSFAGIIIMIRKSQSSPNLSAAVIGCRVVDFGWPAFTDLLAAPSTHGLEFKSVVYSSGSKDVPVRYAGQCLVVGLWRIDR